MSFLYPTLNHKYELLQLIDDSGATSQVYLGRIIGTNHLCAVKIFRVDYLREERTAYDCLNQEIGNLMNLKHRGVVALYDYGNSGVV
jgi:serine/threonine protein kinase